MEAIKRLTRGLTEKHLEALRRRAVAHGRSDLDLAAVEDVAVVLQIVVLQIIAASDFLLTLTGTTVPIAVSFCCSCSIDLREGHSAISASR